MTGAKLFRVLGWIWVVCATFAAIGIWTAAADEKSRIAATQYSIYGGVDPTWLSKIGTAAGFAMLIQGLTIGVGIIAIANHLDREQHG